MARRRTILRLLAAFPLACSGGVTLAAQQRARPGRGAAPGPPPIEARPFLQGQVETLEQNVRLAGGIVVDHAPELRRFYTSDRTTIVIGDIAEEYRLRGTPLGWSSDAETKSPLIGFSITAPMGATPRSVIYLAERVSRELAAAVVALNYELRRVQVEQIAFEQRRHPRVDQEAVARQVVLDLEKVRARWSTERPDDAAALDRLVEAEGARGRAN